MPLSSTPTRISFLFCYNVEVWYTHVTFNAMVTCMFLVRSANSFFMNCDPLLFWLTVICVSSYFLTNCDLKKQFWFSFGIVTIIYCS